MTDVVVTVRLSVKALIWGWRPLDLVLGALHSASARLDQHVHGLRIQGH